MALILVVDDEQNIREILRLIFEDAGHEVIEAADGAEAVTVYRAKRPAVVILDMFMPRQNGLEVLIRLQNEFDDVKVIAVSAGGGTSPRFQAWAEVSKLDALETARLLGAQASLEKPFHPEELVDAVNRLLSGR